MFSSCKTLSRAVAPLAVLAALALAGCDQNPTVTNELPAAGASGVDPRAIVAVRLSNTAGASDEWFAPFPGTDGAIALAMSHAIMAQNLHDADFINRWTNVTADELRAHLQPYTPDWAEKVSGMPAADIRRIAAEFAQAAPACTTMCNRGSSAHLNGFYNDRAIQLLNAVVGSVGKKGGWCWSPWGGGRISMT